MKSLFFMGKWYHEKIDSTLEDLFSFFKFKNIIVQIQYQNDLLLSKQRLKNHFSKIILYSKLQIIIAFTKNTFFLKDYLPIYYYDQIFNRIEKKKTDLFVSKIFKKHKYSRYDFYHKRQIFYCISIVQYFLQKGKKFLFNIKFFLIKFMKGFFVLQRTF